MIVAGDFTEITFNHPIFGSGTLSPVAGEDGTLSTGGLRSEDDMNAISADGRMINKMKRERWMWEGVVTWDAANTDELDVLSKIGASTQETDWTITHISGVVWAGQGTIVGDIQGSGQNAQIGIKISGSDKLEKIFGEI